jgi:hypothetical protein
MGGWVHYKLVSFPARGWLGTLQIGILPNLWVAGYVIEWFQIYRLKHWTGMGQICWTQSYG